MDTDSFFLDDIVELWDHFHLFNKEQLAAMVQEGEVSQQRDQLRCTSPWTAHNRQRCASFSPPAQVSNLNWYAKHARHPYYGDLGLNSGVMLMELDRMR